MEENPFGEGIRI